MNLKKKTFRNYTAYYPILLEPELKIRLVEFKTFYDIDVPEMVRELLREWVKKVDEELNK